MPTNQPSPESNPKDVRKARPPAETQSVKTPDGAKGAQGGGDPPPVNRPNSK
jgi:hypothetical protein